MCETRNACTTTLRLSTTVPFATSTPVGGAVRCGAVVSVPHCTSSSSVKYVQRSQTYLRCVPRTPTYPAMCRARASSFSRLHPRAAARFCSALEAPTDIIKGRCAEGARRAGEPPHTLGRSTVSPDSLLLRLPRVRCAWRLSSVLAATRTNELADVATWLETIEARPPPLVQSSSRSSAQIAP